MTRKKILAAVGVAAGVVALLLWLVLFLVPFLVSWEMSETKKHLAEKAKTVVITQAKVDSAAKMAGKIIFEAKSFKKKMAWTCAKIAWHCNA